ncbi:MAG: phage tail tape measure protein [Propionibacteriaceae bacterium]|nr:phage tail tape measure protein [Propionibacteriaceae bacterium]
MAKQTISVDVVANAVGYITDMTKAARSTLDLAQAVSELAANSAKAKQELDKHRQTLDLTTKAGRQNQAALDDLVASHKRLIEQAEAAGLSTAELGKMQKEAAKQVSEVAAGFGMGAEEAKAYAASLGLVDVEGKKFISSFDRVAGAIQRNESQISTLAAGLTAMGSAMTSAAKGAVLKWADFDQAMSGVRSALSATVTDADKLDLTMGLLSEAAAKAGLKTQFSAIEAAQGITDLVKAGVSARDVLMGGLVGALNLTAAGDLSVADSAEFAATAVSQFALSGRDIPRVADLMAAAAHKTQGDVSDMAEAFTLVGAKAHQLGWSIEDTSAAIALLAHNGIVGTDAGAALHRMLSSLADPTAAARREMENLELSLDDGNGQMVDAVTFAGRLQQSLSGLSEAEKKTSLSALFGAQSIQAAGVLAQAGAKGMGEWRDKVDQAGYAAELARVKNDNLRGDLDRLKSALDGLAVSAGAGADGPLRGLLQGLTALLQLAGEHPKAAQAIMTVITAVGGFALVAGTIMKTVQAVGSFKSAVEALNGLSGVFKNLGTRLTLSLGVVGVALTVAAGVVAAFAGANQRAAERAEDLSSTLNAETGEITENTRAMVANNLEKSGALEAAEKLGMSTDLVIRAAMGEAEAMAALNAQWDEVERTHHNEITLGKIGTHGNIDSVTPAWETVTDAIDENVTALGEAEEASERERRALDGLERENREAAAAIEANTAELRENYNELMKKANLALGAAGAHDNLYSSLNRVAEAAKGTTLDLKGTSDAAINSRKPFLDAAGELQRFIDTSEEAGVSVEEIGRVVDETTGALIDLAVGMGIDRTEATLWLADLGVSREAVNALSLAIQATPTEHKTDMRVNIADAEAKLTNFVRLLERAGTSHPSGYTIKNGIVVIDGQPVAAAGGRISGPGTGTSDSILARVSNGEFVIRERAANSLGYDRLDFINRTGRLPAFAQGGPVAQVTHMTAPDWAAPVRVSLAGLMDGAQVTLVTDEGSFEAHVEQVALRADRTRRLGAV